MAYKTVGKKPAVNDEEIPPTPPKLPIANLADVPVSQGWLRGVGGKGRRKPPDTLGKVAKSLPLTWRCSIAHLVVEDPLHVRLKTLSARLWLVKSMVPFAVVPSVGHN
jgi:hypothetical protein